MAKREFDVSNMEKQGENATMHGVMVEVSPIKLSRKNPGIKYFSGQITDGRKTARMICFKLKL